jgi:hypothetical protein
MPITFANRKKGKSKLTLDEICAFLIYLLKTKVRKLWKSGEFSTHFDRLVQGHSQSSKVSNDEDEHRITYNWSRKPEV